MRSFTVLAVAIAVAIAALNCRNQSSEKAKSAADIAERAQAEEKPRMDVKPAPPSMRAVVAIYTGESEETYDWIGSGVFVSPNYIITAAHLLIEEEKEIPFAPPQAIHIPKVGDKVVYRRIGIGDAEFHTAEIAFIDTTTDIALLKITNPQEFSSYFYIVDFEKPNIGERLNLLALMREQPVLVPFTVASNFFILPWNATEDESLDREQELLVLSPCTHPGSSGGGLVTQDGRLVAVMVGFIYRTHALASPLHKVKDLLLAAMKN